MTDVIIYPDGLVILCIVFALIVIASFSIWCIGTKQLILHMIGVFGMSVFASESSLIGIYLLADSLNIISWIDISVKISTALVSCYMLYSLIPMMIHMMINKWTNTDNDIDVAISIYGIKIDGELVELDN